MKLLRSENLALKAELMSATSSQSTPAAACQVSQDTSTVIPLPPSASAVDSDPSKRQTVRPTSVTVQHDGTALWTTVTKRKPRQPNPIRAEVAPARPQRLQSASGSVPRDTKGATMPRRRRPPKPMLQGVRKECTLQAAGNLPPQCTYVPSRTVFVSRLHPDTTANEIADIIGTEDVKQCIVQKIKTKYESYSPFNLRVDEKVVGKLLSPGCWPDGVTFKIFFSKLFPEQSASLKLPIVDIMNLGRILSPRQPVRRGLHHSLLMAFKPTTIYYPNVH